MTRSGVRASAAAAENSSAEVWRPIVADELALSEQRDQPQVPIGTLLRGMPAPYDEVTVLESEPGTRRFQAGSVTVRPSA